MHRLLSLTLLLLCALGALSQTVQRGVVLEYNESKKKKPLAGVEVSLHQGGTTTTDRRGQFEITFYALRTGDKIEVRRIEKPGYEIFNKEALDQWTLSPAHSFEVIMCRSDRFRRIRDSYQQASSANYARQFERDRRALQAELEAGRLREADYQRQIARLHADYQQQLDRIENYIDRFARIDLSQATADEQAIIALMQQGRIEEAIQRYLKANYAARYIKDQEDLRQLRDAEAKIDRAITGKLASAENNLNGVRHTVDALILGGGKDNANTALNIYETIINTNTASDDFYIEYLHALNDQLLSGRLISAANHFLTRRNISPRNRERALTLLGNAYNLEARLPEAIDAYRRALECTGSITDVTPDYISLRRRIINNNMGYAYGKQHDIARAVEYFQQARSGSPQSAAEVEKIIESYCNQAEFTRAGRFGNMADSLSTIALAMIDSVQRADGQLTADLEFYQPMLLQIKGAAQYSQGNYQQARHWFGRALELRRGLYEKNSRRGAPNLAVSNSNYGRTYFYQDSLAQAKPYFLEAMRLYDEALADGYKLEMLNGYAAAFGFATYCTVELGDTVYTRQLCARADSLLRLTAEFPYQGAKLLQEIGSAYSSLRDYATAVQYLTRAKNYLEPMEAANPDAYIEPLGRLNANIGLNAARMGCDSLAKVAFGDAVRYYDRMVELGEATPDTRNDILRRAYLMLCMGSDWESGMPYLHRLQELEPANAKLLLHECIFLLDAGRIDQARRVYRRLRQIDPEYPVDPETASQLE